MIAMNEDPGTRHPGVVGRAGPRARATRAAAAASTTLLHVPYYIVQSIQ
jgi:hypothetical protein